MKAAVVALACVLRFAASAQADEVARPQPSAAPPAPPEAVRPWVDPSTAQQVGKEQPPVPAPAAPTAVKSEMPDPHEGAKPRQDAKPHQDETSRGGQRLRQCLNPVETRQTVAAHRLTEPFRALRAGRQQGEALRAKLCKWKQDQFVYEVFVLRRDGRVVRVYMNAQNGQAVGALEDH